MPEVLAGAVAVVALIAFRHYAAREVAKGRGAFIWAFAFPMVVGPAVIVWAGARLLLSGQLFGGFLLVFGAALGMVELLFFRRASRAVSMAVPGQDLGEALLEPTTDFMLVMTIGGLTVAIIGGVALVVWAILNQNH